MASSIIVQLFLACFTFRQLLTQPLAPIRDGPCTNPSMLTPIRKSSKYLMDTSSLHLHFEKLTTDPLVDISGTLMLDEFCHNFRLEFIGIRHYQDWISLQKMMRNDDHRWDILPPLEQPKEGDNFFGTGIRYRHKLYPPAFTNEITDETAFLVWDTAPDTSGSIIVQPDADESKEKSVDLIIRYAENQNIATTGKLYLAARDVDETSLGHNYKYICQYPANSDCYRNSDEEVDYYLSDKTITTKTLIWTSKAWFKISTRPVPFADAEAFCTKFKDVGGASFKMWDGAVGNKDPIRTNVLWSNKNEATLLADAILDFFIEQDLYPKTTFFFNSNEKFQRRILKDGKDDSDPFKTIDDNVLGLGVKKDSPAFVICVLRFEQHCQNV